MTWRRRLRPLLLLGLTGALLGTIMSTSGGCTSSDTSSSARALEEVDIDLSGLDSPELRRQAEALPGFLERWRILWPDAPLPDLRLVSGPPSEPAAMVEGTLVVPTDIPMTSPATLPNELAFVVIRALALEERKRARSPPFGLPRIRRSETLLEHAIREGGADFLAALVVGRPPASHPATAAHGEGDGDWSDRESRLWDRFEPVIRKRGVDAAWIDSARFLGYRIVEAYWQRTPDRGTAVREILRSRDPSDLLARSRYQGRGPAPGLPPSLEGLPLATWAGFDCGFVTIGPSRLHACTGERHPTAQGGEGSIPIVLESGAGVDHRSWHAVAPALARRGRVIVYDRGGIGRSDPAPLPRTSDRLAHELAGLLEIVAGPGPYVLAGHGGGSPHLRAFAALYPWRVGGLLLVDAPHEAFPAIRDSLLALDESRAWREEVDARLERLSEGARHEAVGLASTAPDIWLRPLPPIELRVLIAEHRDWPHTERPEVLDQEWRRLQAETALLVPGGSMEVVEGAPPHPPSLLIELLAAQADGAAERLGGATPGLLGEPRGCWRADLSGRGSALGSEPFRLALPGAGAVPPLPGSHPIVPAGGAARNGPVASAAIRTDGGEAATDGSSQGTGNAWYPLGRDRIRMIVEEDGSLPGVPALDAVLHRRDDGSWRTPAGAGAAGSSPPVQLVPVPCEIPD